MKTSQLPSQFQINDEVIFNASESAKIKAKVAGVSFTESKVFYDLVVEHSEGVHYYINGADSAFISPIQNDEK
jgi:hypothetical protein